MNRVNQLVRDDVQRSQINYEVKPDGELVFHPSTSNVNGYGTVHGGILMTLADNAMVAMCYLNQSNDLRGIFITKEIDYKFLYPAVLGADIKFNSSILSTSNNRLICHVKQRDKLIGIATGTYSYRIPKL